MTAKGELLFVSPRFLFPTDSGGKIRTTQILRGLKGGRFRVRLALPAAASELEEHTDDLQACCDVLDVWPRQGGTARPSTAKRLLWLASPLPVSVRADRDVAGARAVQAALDRRPDAVVFDFPHSAVLAPERMEVPSVLFTHNIEAEIFKRHQAVAPSAAHRLVWKSQYEKMRRFERLTLNRFDTVIAVSDRDREVFLREYGVRDCQSIPTGVDTDFFSHRLPAGAGQVVFCGSMDWMANIDGIEYFLRDIWPEVRRLAPGVRMKVVGRAPPESLVRDVAGRYPEWEFTGFVDDVRDHVPGADAFVIPLRVGGGTRIKAFEAMAMGCPIVSTSIGMEGLPADDGRHFLRADDPATFARQIAALVASADLRNRISSNARDLVESHFGFRKAAAVFEGICRATADRGSRCATSS